MSRSASKIRKLLGIDLILFPIVDLNHRSESMINSLSDYFPDIRESAHSNKFVEIGSLFFRIYEESGSFFLSVSHGESPVSQSVMILNGQISLQKIKEAMKFVLDHNEIYHLELQRKINIIIASKDSEAKKL
jgi:hypothetical protein